MCARRMVGPLTSIIVGFNCTYDHGHNYTCHLQKSSLRKYRSSVLLTCIDSLPHLFYVNFCFLSIFDHWFPNLMTLNIYMIYLRIFAGWLGVRSSLSTNAIPGFNQAEFSSFFVFLFFCLISHNLFIFISEQKKNSLRF